MTDLSKISIISVAYNSADALYSMLNTLPKGQEIIVVDNGSDDGFRDAATELGVKLLVPGKNLGFGAACNLGAAAATGDFFLFLNPDTECYPDTLQQFLEGAIRNPHASAFGAVCENENGVSRYRRYNNLTPHEKRDSRPNPQIDTEVQMLVGAAFMVRRGAFQSIGGFDPHIFLYFEDDDICLRLRKEVSPIVYLPKARVIHAGDSSSPYSDRGNMIKGYHWQRAQVYGLQKHGVKFARTKTFLYALKAVLSRRSLRYRCWRNLSYGRLLGVVGAYHGT